MVNGVAPRTYDAGSEMPGEYRETLLELCYHNSEELIGVGGRFEGHIADVMAMASEHAPDSRSMLRIAKFCHEEIKHGHQFYQVYAQIDGDLPRKIEEHGRLEFPRSTRTDPWLDFAITNIFFDRFGAFQISEWIESSYAPFARIAAMQSAEEHRHARMGVIHLRPLLKDAATKAKVQKKIERFWYPLTLDMFGRAESPRNERYRKWGLKRRTNEELRQAYRENLDADLISLGLTPPDPAAGRRVF